MGALVEQRRDRENLCQVGPFVTCCNPDRSCLTQPRRSAVGKGRQNRAVKSSIFPPFHSLYCCQGLATMAHSGERQCCFGSLQARGVMIAHTVLQVLKKRGEEEQAWTETEDLESFIHTLNPTTKTQAQPAPSCIYSNWVSFNAISMPIQGCLSR